MQKLTELQDKAANVFPCKSIKIKLPLKKEQPPHFAKRV